MHRHRQALQKRSAIAESVFWEQELGQDWLHRLVLATIYVFGIKGGIGVDRLSEFFHRVPLEHHVGCSPSALKRLRDDLEEVIVKYEAEQRAQRPLVDQPIEICAGVDETFFDQVILVMMDLVSGYIVLEEVAEDRTYRTWQARAEQALQGLGIRVRYVVSDRAKALVKLALEGFSCPSVPDAFHALRDLTKAMGVCFHLKLARVEEKLGQTQHRLSVLQAKGQEVSIEQRLIKHLSQEAETLRIDQESSQVLLHQASQTLHPFTMSDNRRQSAARVQIVLQQTVAALNTLRARHTGRDNTQAVAKFTRQIPPLASLIDTWWLWVEQSITPYGLDTQTQHWLLARLLPMFYWHQQVAKTKTPTLKVAYQQAFEQAEQALRQHPLTDTLTTEALEHWQAWASEWATKFQRASSAVEGRNGYLSQLNHCARGTPTQRLKVMTVIHNFDLKRPDGTTAAERLFGIPPPDLFDWVIARMGPLPRPRKARSRPKPNLLNLQCVPA